MTDYTIDFIEGDTTEVNFISDSETTIEMYGSADPFPFYTLTDVPHSYVGQAGLSPRVKATEDGLEFAQALTPGEFSALFDTYFELKTTDYLAEGSTNFYDKIVSLTPGSGISISGTYPDFTITNNAVQEEQDPIWTAWKNLNIETESIDGYNLEFKGLSQGVYSGEDSSKYLVMGKGVGNNYLHSTVKIQGELLGVETNSVDPVYGKLYNSSGIETFDWNNLRFPTETNNGFLKTISSNGTITVDNNEYLNMNQTTPQTFIAGEVSGTGLLKVTSGEIGLDETQYVTGTPWENEGYLTSETDPLSLHLDQTTPQVILGPDGQETTMSTEFSGTGYAVYGPQAPTNAYATIIPDNDGYSSLYAEGHGNMSFRVYGYKWVDGQQIFSDYSETYPVADVYYNYYTYFNNYPQEDLYNTSYYSGSHYFQYTIYVQKDGVWSYYGDYSDFYSDGSSGDYDVYMDWYDTGADAYRVYKYDYDTYENYYYETTNNYAYDDGTWTSTYDYQPYPNTFFVEVYWTNSDAEGYLISIYDDYSNKYWDYYYDYSNYSQPYYYDGYGDYPTPDTSVTSIVNPYNDRIDGQFITTIADGTKPIDVISTTVCDNLNADMIDGYHASELALDSEFGTLSATSPVTVTGGRQVKGGSATIAVTNGNMTGTLPIQMSATRQVLGGAVSITHYTGAGYKHMPTGGSVGQVLRNSASGNATWGTATNASNTLTETNINTNGGNNIVTAPNALNAIANKATLSSEYNLTTQQYALNSKGYSIVPTNSATKDSGVYDLTTTFTINFWMKGLPDNQTRKIIGSSAINDYIQVQSSGGNTIVYARVNGAGSSAQWTDEATNWHMYTITQATTSMKIYRDGVLYGTGNTVAGNQFTLDKIFEERPSTNIPFDEFAFWSGTALTVEQLLTIYNGGRGITNPSNTINTGYPVKPTYLFHFDEGSGTVLTESISAANATWAGAPTYSVAENNWDETLFRANIVQGKDNTIKSSTIDYGDDRCSVGVLGGRREKVIILNDTQTTDIAYAPANVPEYSTTYVKATTEFKEAYKAIDPTLSLTGSYVNGGWMSAFGTTTNQRFHIDVGSEKVITDVYYENQHDFANPGTYGAKDFTLWGSNDPTAFATLTYATDTNWTQLNTDINQFEIHVSADTADPKYFKVKNAKAYRYYAFKIANNWGNTSFMGIRRLALSGSDSIYSQYHIVCDKATAMTVNLPAATGSGRHYYIKNVGAGVVTIDPNASETIDGETTQALQQWESMEIIDYTLGGWAII